jgi:ADP-ribose pyrophosphatase
VPPHPDAPHQEIEVLESRRLHTGKIFDVVAERLRLPSGLEQDLEIVAHPGAVCIAPLLEDGRLLLVRQYRHAAGDWLLEVPAGRLEAGEDPLTAARRELEEETGHRAGRWTERTAFLPAPGFCSERITLFEARELAAVEGGGREADPDEEIELVRRTPREVLEGGEVRDAKTLLAAALLALS